MAVAAFKSSSRRGNLTSSQKTSSSERHSRDEAPKKAPVRRSRSVSALSRTNLDVSTEFVNKMDNPLFWSSSSAQDDGIESINTIAIAKFDKITPSSGSGRAKSANSNSENGKRGRPVTRNGVVSNNGSMVGRKESGRSLTRVDTARRKRSASQCPVPRRHFSTSESEAEQDFGSAKSKGENNLKFVESDRKGGLFRSNKGVMGQMKNLQRWSSQHSSLEASGGSVITTMSGLQTQNWEDAASTASSASFEVKTIKTLCEQMKSRQADKLEAGDIYEKVRSEVRRAISEIQNDLESAIQRSNASAIAVTHVADIPPDLVNPGAVELLLDIRREYAKKLEESQERARKLQAELAVEEHRGQELDRILKEVLPNPKTPNVQKSRPARKASIERRRMSKRLAEDAMSYFDECVSLSTFDSSDFSSQEDPPLNLVGPPSPSHSLICLSKELGNQRQFMNYHDDILQPTGSISRGPILDQVNSPISSTDCGSNFQFSSRKPSGTSELQQDIQKYIKKFDKSVLKLSTVRSNYCDLDEYSYQPSAESLLADRVLLKNRIESGSLLLCGGGMILSAKNCGIGI